MAWPGALGDHDIPEAPLYCSDLKPSFEQVDGVGESTWKPLSFWTAGLLVSGGLAGTQANVADTMEYVVEKQNWKVINLHKNSAWFMKTVAGPNGKRVNSNTLKSARRNET